MLDHPGGFDSDGENLWVPISQSRRNGQTMIRKFSIRSLIGKGDAKENGYDFTREELNEGCKQLQESDEGLTEFELHVVSGGVKDQPC